MSAAQRPHSAQHESVPQLGWQRADGGRGGFGRVTTSRYSSAVWVKVILGEHFIAVDLEFAPGPGQAAGLSAEDSQAALFTVEPIAFGGGESGADELAGGGAQAVGEGLSLPEIQ